MARFVVAVLLLTLALAPVASAHDQNQGEAPFAAWRAAISRAFDWLFTWTSRTGACIEPSSLQVAPRKASAYIVPSGLQAAPRETRVFIEYSGLRSRP